MSVEAIVRVVDEAGAAEAEQIVAAARDDAAARVAAATNAAEARTRDACERADPGDRASAMRVVNAARLRQLERRVARSADLVDAALQAAAERLATIAADPESERWRAALGHLLAETASLVGPGATLLVRPQDLEAAKPIATRLACRLAALDGDGGAVPGVLGRSADGRVEVDATLTVRLARARSRLAEPVARLLGMDA
jgi:vacuolar-type H+-ATPase subunit E/Vma4